MSLIATTFQIKLPAQKSAALADIFAFQDLRNTLTHSKPIKLQDSGWSSEALHLCSKLCTQSHQESVSHRIDDVKRYLEWFHGQVRAKNPDKNLPRYALRGTRLLTEQIESLLENYK